MSETTGARSKMGKSRFSLRGWELSSDGASVSRTLPYDSADEAGKAAKWLLAKFQKAGEPVGVRLDNANVTVRLDAKSGKVGDPVRKLIKRILPNEAIEETA